MSGRPAVAHGAPVSLASTSTLALLAANVLPLACMFFFDWNAGDVLLVYWSEGLAIGFYTLVKLGVVVRMKILVVGPLFIATFGFLMMMSLAIFLGIAHELEKIAIGSYQKQDLSRIALGLLPGIIAFTVSHGVSFVTNFLGRQEYRHYDDEALAIQAFQRAVPMIFVGMGGGFIVSVFDNPQVWFLAVFVLKTMLDVFLHIREHQW